MTKDCLEIIYIEDFSPHAFYLNSSPHENTKNNVIELEVASRVYKEAIKHNSFMNSDLDIFFGRFL